MMSFNEQPGEKIVIPNISTKDKQLKASKLHEESYTIILILH